MKKLTFLFLILLSLTFIVGCNSVKKTVRFNPEKTSEESSTTVTPIEDEKEAPSIEVKEKEVKGTFAITKPAEATDITTGYFVITGTSASNTDKIMVNDYQLKKFSRGQMKWSYIASTNAGTLKEGANEYTVKAFDKDGNEIGSQSTALNYTPVAKEVTALPGVGASSVTLAAWLTLMTVSAFLYIKNKATV
jgi:flagellar basal body L-ring protein FlgH